MGNYQYNKYGGHNSRDSRSGDRRKPYNDGYHSSGSSREMNTEPKPIPANYVDEAEKIMRNRLRITTSKLRNILTLITDIYNAEIDRTEEMLTEESAANLQMARIRIAYECGREPLVQEFVEKSHLLNYVKQVCKTQLRREFIDLARYMEALVAYHRFFGGKD